MTRAIHINIIVHTVKLSCFFCYYVVRVLDVDVLLYREGRQRQTVFLLYKFNF